MTQTVALMQADDPTEFFDVAQRNKKFGRVDRENGVLLIEKYVLSFTLPLWQKPLARSTVYHQAHNTTTY